MNIFIKRLKEIRKDKGLSMSELANKIGVSTNTISRWERGERIPNLEALVALAKFLSLIHI